MKTSKCFLEQLPETTLISISKGSKSDVAHTRDANHCTITWEICHNVQFAKEEQRGKSERGLLTCTLRHHCPLNLD